MSDMRNTVSLRAYRTLKECRVLFNGYDQRLSNMEKGELLSELERYRTESNRYPNHLLTIVKGEILMKELKKRATTAELKAYIQEEEVRLYIEINRRLYE